VPELYDDIQAGKLKLIGFDPKDTNRQMAAKDPFIKFPFNSGKSLQIGDF
jgi:hypothetical protein